MFIKLFFKKFSHQTNSNAVKTIITTPIFYVNSKPHIGHLYSAILASAVKQVKILNMKNSKYESMPILSTGTDEHGLKIQQKARDEKTDPQTFCTVNSKIFKDLFDNSKIEYDYYIRTSDEEHKKFTRSFWHKLHEANKIKKYEYSGYYSVQEESFIPEKDLIKKGEKYYTSLSIASNQHVEYISEENYQINFTKDDLDDYTNLIQKERINFIPKTIQNEVKSYITQNVTNLCISRPKKRVTWGIDVPNDDTQVIYVWFEALLNYLTVASIEQKEKFHPANIEFIHIIGKDISKFHCYIWPLMLLLNKMFPFKITILMHNYWLKNGTKMSKSIGNVVSPDTMINKYGIDAVRFYFLAAGPQLHDISFDEKNLRNVFYRNIPDTFINLILRLTNNKIINVNDINKIEEFEESYIEKIVENMCHVENAKKELWSFNFIQAQHHIHLVLLSINNLVHSSEFWKKTDDRKLIQQITIFSLEFVRIATVLFSPYLPELMKNVGKFLGMKEDEFKFKFCFFRIKNETTFKKIYLDALVDTEIENFNGKSYSEGYFNIDMDYKNSIFVNKVKV